MVHPGGIDPPFIAYRAIALPLSYGCVMFTILNSSLNSERLVVGTGLEPVSRSNLELLVYKASVLPLNYPTVLFL